MGLERLTSPEVVLGSASRRQPVSGFTLLEVLVALAIFAMAASVLMVSDGRAIRQTARIQDKIHASWLADTHLNRYYVEEIFPATGERSKTQTQSGRDWYIRDIISNTAQKNLRKVEVQVFQGTDKPDDKDQPIYRLTGYIRRPVNANAK